MEGERRGRGRGRGAHKEAAQRLPCQAKHAPSAALCLSRAAHAWGGCMAVLQEAEEEATAACTALQGSAPLHSHTVTRKAQCTKCYEEQSLASSAAPCPHPTPRAPNHSRSHVCVRVPIYLYQSTCTHHSRSHVCVRAQHPLPRPSPLPDAHRTVGLAPRAAVDVLYHDAPHGLAQALHLRLLGQLPARVGDGELKHRAGVERANVRAAVARGAGRHHTGGGMRGKVGAWRGQQQGGGRAGREHRAR